MEYPHYEHYEYTDADIEEGIQQEALAEAEAMKKVSSLEDILADSRAELIQLMKDLKSDPMHQRRLRSATHVETIIDLNELYFTLGRLSFEIEDVKAALNGESDPQKRKEIYKNLDFLCALNNEYFELKKHYLLIRGIERRSEQEERANLIKLEGYELD